MTCSTADATKYHVIGDVMAWRSQKLVALINLNNCDRLQENRAQRGVRKYREKIDRFLKNVLFQAGRERLGLL